MKYIKLTRGAKAMVDDEDFEKVNQWNWQLNTDGYAQRRNPIVGGIVLMHWDILGKFADHINGNRLDNQHNNLRIATKSQNGFNQPKSLRRKASSIYKGVSWCKKAKMWRAVIFKEGKQYWIGCFRNERWAAMAYDIACKDLHKDFGILNFPKDLKK